MTPSAPQSERELADRAACLAGLTLAEIANNCGFRLPVDLRRQKGIVGEMLELVLGATASSRPVPDFENLGIELKTIPLDRHQRPAESTHVCTVALQDLVGQRWASCTVRVKLARVLWIPIEARHDLALAERRVGTPTLWTPSREEETVLRQDWEEHMELIATGRFDELDSRMGTYLQVRPKAPNRAALRSASDASGTPAATLPRGFYLRPRFTSGILENAGKSVGARD